MNQELKELVAALAQAMKGGGQAGGAGVATSGGGLQQIGLNGSARAGRKTTPVQISSHGVEVDSSRPVQTLGYRLPDGLGLRGNLAGSGSTVFCTGSYVVSKAGRVIETKAFSVGLIDTPAQTLVPAATDGRVHTLQHINCYNSNASTQTVTIDQTDNAILVKQLVPTGETLCWQNGLWTVTFRGVPIPVSAGGTGLSTLAAGSLIYGAGTNPMTALAIGTAGQILQVNAAANAPVWNSVSGDATLSSAGALTVASAAGSFALLGDISPSISAAQNDWNPSGLSSASRIYVTATGAGRSITGLAGGSAGRVITLVNAGSLFITLENEDAGSSAANRFSLGSTDISLWTGDSVVLVYDENASGGRWRCVAKRISEPSFSAYRSSTQAVTTGVGGETVELNVEGFDTHGWFDTTTYRFTPLLPGKYLFTWCIGLASLKDGGYFQTQLRKNGSSVTYGSQSVNGAIGDAISSGSRPLQMNGSTDYVDLFVAHDHGSDRNIFGAESLCNFNGVYVSG